MDSDKISIDLKEHPELAAELAGSSAGDTVKLTVEFTIDEVATDMLVGSLTECEDPEITPGPQSEDDEKPSEEATAGVLSVMASGNRSKKTKY